MKSNDYNILIITASLSRKAGGLLGAISALVNKIGLKINVYGLKDEFTESDKLYWSETPTYALSIFGPKSFGYSPRLKRQVLSASYDLVHLHGLWMYPQLLSFKWQSKFKRPVVISPHGMLDPWALRNSSWKKKIIGYLFVNKSLKKANCIHALCYSEYESIRNFGLRNPVAIIPNGVNLPQKIEKKYRNKNIKNLLYLGRIHPKKGLKLLIEALDILKSKNHSFLNQWQLKIVGWDEGGHTAQLKTLCEKYNLDSHVEFLGPLFEAKKEDVLRDADAFILPSYSEGLPMSVLEAWSYQLPVLMTKECNLPEGFEAQAAIKLELDPSSIAGQLAYLNNLNKEQLEEMSNKGYNLVSSHFTWGCIAQQMEQTYSWLLGNTPLPSFVKLD